MKNNRKRIAQLNERIERLIEMNRAKGYTSMITGDNGTLIPNPKANQYSRILLSIHKEKAGLYLFNRENNHEYRSLLNKASSMNMNLLKHLTIPIL